MSFINDNKNDNYITNKKAWEDIKKYIPKNKIIWSPFYCDGKQKEYFKDLDFDIIHIDKDFFSYTPEYDIIIDNIPFSKKREIFKKLKELDKPFIIICPSVLLGYKYFLEDFDKHLQIIIPKCRIKFNLLNSANKNYTPPYGCYYYCYKMNFEKDLIFI
jgi:hypothetical protein